MMKKKLGRFDILALAVGSIIGWGSFTLPGNKFLPESGVLNTALGLILGGIAITFIVNGYQYMMTHHFEDGGEFSYTYKSLGRKHGFVVGWFLILCYISMVPLNATAFVLVVKKLFGNAVTFGYLYDIGGASVYLSDIMIASVIILVFAYINKRGLKTSSRVQNVMMFLTVVNIVIIFGLMLTKVGTINLSQYYIKNESFQFSWKQIAQVFAIAPFLFVGFDVIPQVTTDLDFKPSHAIRVTIIAVFTGVLFYNLNNLTTALAFGPVDAQAREWALGDAVVMYLGWFSFILLLISLAGAVSGGINGFMLGGSKLLGALSHYDMIPAKYKTQNKAEMYTKAIDFIVIVSLIAPWFGRQVIIYIVDMSSLLAAIVYGYVCWISYQQSNHKQGFAGMLVSSVFIALLVIPFSPGRLQLPSFMFMLVWSLLGYLYYRQSQKKQC